MSDGPSCNSGTIPRTGALDWRTRTNSGRLTPTATYGNREAPVSEPGPAAHGGEQSELRELRRRVATLEAGRTPPRHRGRSFLATVLIDPELPYLVALLAVHAASPPVGTAYRQGERRLLFAVDDGTELDDPEFGGADLIVGTALLDTAAATADRREAS